MNMFNIKTISSFIVCAVFLLLLNVACDKNSLAEPVVESAIEIIYPLAGDQLSVMNTNKIIVRYNPDFVIEPLDRYFSYDKKDWKPMTVKIISRGDVSIRNATNYCYYVMLWKPEDDSVHIGDSVYLRTKTYGTKPILHEIGPVTIY